MSLTPANLGKSLSTPSSTSHNPATSAGPATSTFESARRSQQIPITHSTPKKGQAARKQHRQQRRPERNRFDEDDAMAEIRAVRNASSRRGQTSITHLLNYSLPSRPYYDHNFQARSYRRNPTWSLGSGHHAIDKARYVHANYRFVVSPTGNYATQAIDADEHLDWGDVLQIIASAESQSPSCPICLSEPVAPRMAKCGHVFCLSCLLRFMHTIEDDGPASERKARWKKCPICEDSIYISEVRPVRFYAGQESPLPRPGDDVVLRLMMRSSKSTLALPKEAATDVLNSGQDIPWHFAASVLDYARIMKGTSGYMIEQFDREIEELIKQEKEDEILFHEDGEWTQKAIRVINFAKEKAKEIAGAELVLLSNAKSTAPSQTGRASQPSQPEHDFYFYSSPPHLYLSPLDIRILKTKYGSFSQFPTTLLPRVEHISTGHVVDDALRKRARYLGHLPYGCLISFLECDWTDIVSADILATFGDEIERRRKRNKDKEVQEERERLQAERIEAAAIQRGSRRVYGASDDEVTVRFSSSSPPKPAVDFNDFQPLGKEATTPPNPRHGFAHLASMSTSPTASRTVWGTPTVAVSPDMKPKVPDREVDDGWLKDDQLLGNLVADDLALQMESFGIEEAEGDKGLNTSVPAPATGGGKKKKKQKITLMSTGGRRGN